ncbi:MAG: hypothetical protein ACFFDW_09675 [Candidatus Thorarchaeota archaeon]
METNHTHLNLDTNILPKRYQSSSMDKLTFSLMKFGNQQIYVFLTADNHFDKVRMKKAIRLLYDIEPVLGCKFIDDPKTPFWERIENIDEYEYCIIKKTTQLDDDINDFIKSSCDPRSNIPVQSAIFESKNFDTLCVKTNHAVLDGGALQEYVVKISDLYRKLKDDPNYFEEPNIHGERSVKQVLDKFNIFQKIFIFFKNMSAKPNWAFPWIGTSQESVNYIIRRFDSNRFKQIKEFGKKFDATINDMVLTAFYRALFQILYPPKKKKLVTVCTINLRMYLENNKADSLCNLSSSAYPRIDFIPDESFIDTLKRVTKEMNFRKKFAPGIGPAWFIENVFRANYSKVKKSIQKRFDKDIKRKATHPVFTNVGLVTTNHFNFGDVKIIDAYMLTPIMGAPGFIFGLLTFNEIMSICVGFYDGSYDKLLVEKFIDLIDEELALKN